MGRASLTSDHVSLRAYARRRARRTLVASAIAIPIAAGILVLDYRFMLLAIIALVAPVIIGIEAFFARRSARLDYVRADCEDGSVVVRSPEGEMRAEYPSIRARAQDDALVLAFPEGPNRWRQWIIPAETDRIAAFSAELEANGVTVAREDGSAGKVVSLLVRVLAGKVLGVVAAGLVLGALANIVLALAGKGGSYLTGGLLLLGALACLTVVALLQPRGERSK